MSPSTSQEGKENASVLDAATRLCFTALAREYPERPISEAAVIHNGRGLRKRDRDETGPYSVFGAGGKVGNHSDLLTTEPLVVVGRKGSAGKATYAPDGGWVIDTAYFAQPSEPSKLDCKFLFYGISCRDFSADTITTAIPGINRTAIGRHTIPIPPRDVQLATVRLLDAASHRSTSSCSELPPVLSRVQRVVARIDELAAKIEEAQRLKALSVAEGAALYAAERARIFASPSYVREPLGHVFDLVNGRAFKPSDWTPFGLRIVRIQNLKYADALYNRHDGWVDPKFLLHDGDILFAWSGQIVSLGAHIWQDGEAILNQHIHRVVPRRKMDSVFVMEGFNALIDEMRGKVRGLEMFHIRKRELNALLFPVPTLTEQRRAAARIAVLRAKVEGLTRVQSATAAELDALLPSILDKAFKGEL